MVLAKNTYTPVQFWLSITLRELCQWIGTNNDLVYDQKKEMEERR